MAMNPKTQECFGRYGYGTGYFIRDTHNRRLVTGKEQLAFCDTCPKRVECWNKHKDQVNIRYPLETAAFIAAMDQAKASGDSQAGGRLAAKRMEEGNPDPWMKVMLTNIQLGIADNPRLQPRT